MRAPRFIPARVVAASVATVTVMAVAACGVAGGSSPTPSGGAASAPAGVAPISNPSPQPTGLPTGIGGAVGSASGTPSSPLPQAGPTPGGPAGPGSATTLDSAYPIPAGALFVAPAGNDSAAGTLGSPLRTVTTALAKAPVGATIVLRAGTYRESITSATRRVTIQPYPHEQAWLSGSDVVTAWGRSGRGWRSSTWRSPLCQTCYNPQAVDAGHPLAGRPNQVFVNGRQLTQVAGDSALTAGTFYLAADKSVVIGADPGGATVEVSSRWKAIQLNDNASGSVIRGIGIKQYAPVWDESQLASVILNTANVTFTGNVLTQIAGTALAVTRPGATVTGNSVTHNGYRGIVANRADGLVLAGNHVDVNNTAGFSTTSCGSYCTVAGVKVAHTRGLTVSHNSFAGNTGAGFWCDLGCINSVITGNTVTGNTGNGLFYEVSAGGTITGNVITGNGRGLKISGSATVAVSGNQFTDNGIELGVYDDPRSPSTDAYSSQNGLTWNTANVTISGNTFADRPGTTVTVLDTNRTAQVSAPGMIRSFGPNTYRLAGAGRVYWCAATCVTYPTIAAFSAAVHLG